MGPGAYGPKKLPNFFAALYVRYGPPDVSRQIIWQNLNGHALWDFDWMSALSVHSMRCQWHMKVTIALN